MNSGLEQLQPYPFEKLAQLKRETSVITDIPHIDLSIGEPKHTTSELILNKLQKNYPRQHLTPQHGASMNFGKLSQNG